ncbi:hypothetical protein HYU92_06895 [Candidatus Curtissbacteria bacterium]|nr:hypothetical protein [Candidatus Curtissbacteria bacterium]
MIQILGLVLLVAGLIYLLKKDIKFFSPRVYSWTDLIEYKLLAKFLFKEKSIEDARIRGLAKNIIALIIIFGGLALIFLDPILDNI